MGSANDKDDDAISLRDDARIARLESDLAEADRVLDDAGIERKDDNAHYLSLADRVKLLAQQQVTPALLARASWAAWRAFIEAHDEDPPPAAPEPSQLRHLVDGVRLSVAGAGDPNHDDNHACIQHLRAVVGDDCAGNLADVIEGVIDVFAAP